MPVSALRLSLAFAAVVALVGCSGSSSTDGGTDAGNPGTDSGQTTDSGQVTDAGYSDFQCGTGNAPHCQSSQTCCVSVSDGGANVSLSCVASCPNAQDAVICGGPNDCAATPSDPICCGVAVQNGGTYPNCNVTAFGTSCQSSCTTSIPVFTCAENYQVIICRTSNDCTTDPNYPLCCTTSKNGASLTFCMSQAIAGFIDAGCQ
jgi:hypothetical protein